MTYIKTSYRDSVDNISKPSALSLLNRNSVDDIGTAV